MKQFDPTNASAAYQALCTSYHNIDGFRGTLLGFLPLATGGLFILAGEKGKDIIGDPQLAVPIGLFGFFIALGLFTFEIYGIRRCTHLIILGQHLETQMKVNGQFQHRPNGLEGFITADWIRLINEPMASGVIYPAVCAAWLYIALHSLNPFLASIFSLLVFGLGFCFTYRYNRWLAHESWDETEGKIKNGLEQNTKN